jgi:hypothetical protein
LANARHRQQSDHTERQIARMNRYYADLLRELQEQMQRVTDRGDDPGKFAGRREALEREEKVRVAELRQKSTLHVQVRLLNVLVIQQAKLLIQATVRTNQGNVEPLELVWDPLTEALEASPCQQCQRPTFTFVRTRLGRLACRDCVLSMPMPDKASRR